MERISIFNYEAFYLDYLEGRLSENDTALLLAFLEEYPELIVDDEPLPTFNASSIFISNELKNSLKQYTEEDSITIDNAEHFLIANAEGLLSETKKKELEKVVQAENLGADEKLFKAVYYKPDLNLVYTDKENLKQNRKIAFWPYAASLAAACVIAVVFLWPPSEEIKPETANQEVPKEIIQPENKNKVTPIIEDVISPKEYVAEQKSNATPVKLPQERRAEVEGTIERKETRTIIASASNYQIEPISKDLYDKIIPPTQAKEGFSSLAINEMENPIELITHTIANKTNSQIDFRVSDRKKASKGFYLKIGKLEVSRKKYR